ncbi:hypothetical protein MHU86_6689 [Fragilaria crotonensis]|nr:hypothetical protein MHU86_6689 [Fragilaria crotonensis]
MHVSASGSNLVSLPPQVRDYLCGLASWVEVLMNEADHSLQQVLCDILGSVYTVACDWIDNICVVLRNRDNSPFVDKLSSPPPVLPANKDLIADELKELIMQYRTNGLLKQEAIDSFPEGTRNDEDTSSLFVDAWSVLQSDGFQHLHAFCGGIATLFPGMCTLESDFSGLHWEKDDKIRKSISDFGLEAILQAKQFLAIQLL